MMAKGNDLYIGLALLLVLLGLAEDLTGALLIVGILTSFAGVALFYFKGMRKRH